MRSAPITGGGAALSRSKLGAIAPVGLLVPVGADLSAKNSRMNKSFANKFAPTYSVITHNINAIRVV
jgi:hypothetical protein